MGFPPHIEKRPYCPAKPQRDYRVVPHNQTGGLTSLNKYRLESIIPAVTREYTPGSHCNLIKTMRLLPQREMRPDSPALHAEQFRVTNQTPKEP